MASSLLEGGDGGPWSVTKTKCAGSRRMTSNVGKKAVGFELQDGSGAVHPLQDYAGHWVLLVFHRHLG